MQNNLTLNKSMYEILLIHACPTNTSIYTRMFGVILTQIIIHERPDGKLENKGKAHF